MLVEGLAAHGVPHRHIAEYIGVSEPTLRKYYDGTLQKAHGKFAAKLTQTMAIEAFGDPNNTDPAKRKAPNTTLLIYLSKALLGWRDRDAASDSSYVPKREAYAEAAKTPGAGTGWADILDKALN